VTASAIDTEEPRERHGWLPRGVILRARVVHYVRFHPGAPLGRTACGRYDINLAVASRLLDTPAWARPCSACMRQAAKRLGPLLHRQAAGRDQAVAVEAGAR